jgi:tRNA threonylcarbamoyl adenosine modification protein (Sua5/YciO/YrdC/YwlC family)
MKTYNFLSDKHLKKFLRLNEDFTFLHFTGNMLGIGAPISSKSSIARINLLKERSNSKGYIILIPGRDWLNDLHLKPDKVQKRLIQQYWPGEMTLIFDDRAGMFPQLSRNNRIAVRVPGDPMLRKFIEKLSVPIISTSVNKSGFQPETDLNIINAEYSEWFDFKLLPTNLSSVTGKGSTIIDFKDDQLTILREGSISEAEIRLSLEQPLILFVCTGNICRSPLAEYYARHLFAQQNLQVRVESAGFLDSGYLISENSRIILEEMGIDSEHHRSRQIDNDLIQQSWLILTMENRHKTELNRMNPNVSEKVFTLSEFCGKEYCRDSLDIDDPYGSELANYRSAFKLIQERIECLSEFLKEEV